MQIINNPTEQTHSGEKPKCEVADIFRQYGSEYMQNQLITDLEKKVMHDILICRTHYLGGHIEQCDTCGGQRNAYSSCGNRHCPKCQGLAKARWLQDRKAELLPVTYFHNVFTLPHEINAIALGNKKVIYDILFKSVSGALNEFGKNPANKIGGKLGFTALLHTWDQKLFYHLHLHCVIAGGGLAFDSSRWIPAPSGDYLFCVKALSKVFQGKFIDFLNIAFKNGQLAFSGKSKMHGTKKGFKNLINQLWSKNWVVYSKKPFSSPAKVLDYLGRYTHRVAISNHRIVNIKDGRITFTYRDRKDGDKLKESTIKAAQFMRRFFLHVLPKQSMRIRHFGFLANRSKKQNLGKCRKLMGLRPPLLQPSKKMTPRELMLELTGIDISQCPFCKKGVMQAVEKLPEQPGVSLSELFT